MIGYKNVKSYKNRQPRKNRLNTVGMNIKMSWSSTKIESIQVSNKNLQKVWWRKEWICKGYIEYNNSQKDI